MSSQSTNNVVTSVLDTLREFNKIGNSILVSDGRHNVIHTKLQSFLDVKFAGDSQLVYHIILENGYKCESLVPGSFSKFVDELTCTLSQTNVNTSTKICAKEDLNAYVNSFSLGEERYVHNMLLEALEIAGYGGRIIVEKTKTHNPGIELVHGYNFPATPVFKPNLKFENPKIMCADGYVEFVSEIHHFLQAAFEHKEPVVAFVRGISEEVTNTLRVNFDRGSLKVMPIKVNFDINGLNTINDIAVVTGADMITPLKGQTFSSIDYDTLPRVESVVTSQNSVLIKHKHTKHAVAAHVKELRNKRNLKQDYEEVAETYDKRIRSLAPNHVIIRLPDDLNYVRNAQFVDYVLRGIKTLVLHGVERSTDTIVPASMNPVAKLYANKCKYQLNQLGYLVDVKA